MPRQQIFVGRAGELAELVGLVQAAVEERPGVALLQGEAGAGKTRLLDELVARMPRRTLVGRGAGVGFLGGRLPYAPLVAALRSLLSRLPAAEVASVLGPDPSDLALLLPELGARPDAVSDQARLVSSVSSVFDRATELRPTLLVVDDLHYADVATLEMLAYLCAGLDRQRLAVVVAYRPDEVGDVLAEWVQDRRRGPHVREVTLGPMSLAETTEQLAGLLDGDAARVLDPVLASRIHARSGGNPYAAEALMRAALAGDADSLPASLREVLVRRTRACSPATAELLRTFAAAGERVAPSVLTEVAKLRGLDGDLDTALDEAVRGQLLVVEGDGSLSLRHALLAEALYADLLPGERKQLHGLLADTLERFDARPATLAEHADRAGDARRALMWSMRAAEAAEEVHAYDEAHRQFERVRRLWPLVPAAAEIVGADAVDVFARAAAMAAICDEDATAVEIIERVRSWLQADPDVDPVRLGLLEAQYARFLLDAGRTDAALVAARRAVDLVPAQPATSARAVVVSGLVHVLDWVGGGPDWEPLADEAVDVARATGDRAALARALVVRTTVKPDAPGLLRDAREAVRLGLADGTPELVGQTYSNLVDCLQCAGEGRAGVSAARDGVAAVTERGLGIRYGSWLSSQAAELCVTYGWWDEAEAYLQDALRDTRHVQGTNRDYALVNRARLSALRGDFDRLDTDLREIGRLPAVLELLRCEAHAEGRLWRGDANDALTAVVDLVEGATPRLLTMAAPLAWLGARALADLAESRLADDPGRAAPTEGWEQTTGVVRDLVEVACGAQALPGARPHALRLLCQAETSRHASPSGAGPGPWAEAVAALEGAERPYLTAYARWRLAHAYVSARQHAAAADALRRSHAAACALRAGPLLSQVESLARRTRIDLRPPVEVPAGRADTVNPKVAALTAREREILGHLTAGRTNGEIARALVISTKTASVHVSNILRKLGVATRYEAAELAERLDAV